MTRVGVLGCGRIAHIHHLPILAREAGVELAALAEEDPAALTRARAIAPRARPVSDWRAVLDDPSIAAVVICLPTGLHAEAARASFAVGKDVYLEKPLATTLAEGRDAVLAWRSSGRIGMLGFNQRFHPLVRAAREAVREGRIGRAVAARVSSLSPPRELPAWKTRRAEGGGALLDLASHQADLARFLFGEEVSEVSASVRSVRSEDDDVSVTMTMESGLRVDCHASFATVRENRFEVLGEAGRIVVDRVAGRMRFDPVEPPRGRTERLARAARRVAGAPRAVRAALGPPRDPSYRLALAAFVRATRDRARPSPDFDDGARSLAVVVAARTAALEGRRTPVASTGT